ncbi:MAG: hypothetical protein WDA74_04410 [Spirochaetota bacterium]
MKILLKKTLFISLFILCLNSNSNGELSKGLDIILTTPKFNYAVNENIILNTHVKNISDSVITFFVYDSPERNDIYDRPRGDISGYTTFQPIVYDMQGRNAELIVPYIIEKNNIDEILSWMVQREIKLGPGETFIRTQNLKNIYKFETDRDYRIRLNFFPRLGIKNDSLALMSSNEIKFHVNREKVYVADEKPDISSISLTPSEVVLLVLNAEYENRFTRGLKYIDIEKYINSYPEFIRKYNLADDFGKKIIEKEFIRYLILKRKDYLLSFEIKNEEFLDSGTVAFVDVIAERKNTIKTERFRYRYRLEKNRPEDKIWLLAGLEASVTKDVKR